MRYERIIRFSASHFNSRQSYITAWGMIAAHGAGDVLQQMRTAGAVVATMPSTAEIMAMLRDIHGHNFKVRVVIDASTDEDGFVVDDVELTKLLLRYDNMNVSMHPDFTETRTRATTENMAQKLFNCVNEFLAPNATAVLLELYETDDIKATAT